MTDFREVLPRVNSDELERDILAFWDKEKIFKRSLARTEGKPLFTFYDGPPYATGKPHYGHILQSAIKDTVLRYKTMRGYYTPRRVGWDTHGLPIENIVEKELAITNKRQIEDDITGFNRKCRDVVFRYVDVFTQTLKRIGRWADYDSAYSTLDRDYMESEWWVFKQLWDQDLIYKDFRSSPYCIRCATPLSNFEVSMGYADVTDTAAYVLMDVHHSSLPDELQQSEQAVSLLIWTTTPWTLPGNVAIAVSPDLEYVSVEYEGKSIIVARSRVSHVFGPNVAANRAWKTSELEALRYEPVFADIVQPEDRHKACRIVLSDHVTAEEGTGLVHIAPAFGEEDFVLGDTYNLPVLRTVDQLGMFTNDVVEFAGKNIFDSNGEIVKLLKERGSLFKSEPYTHSYPHCWRCDKPLIYYALDTWFVNVQSLKKVMFETNEAIHWIPDHVKRGRFLKGIESAPDWAVSRNRFWSTPIPIWECSSQNCEHRVCVGSIGELKSLSGVQEIQDLHRPYVDDITWKCPKCQTDVKRIPEVLDVWFDSGSMPYSQWHYPFERKDFVEQGYPADFIAESIEMTRAWFYVLHVLASALTRRDIGLGKNKPAFSNVIASGLIFAEDGQKLSKKLKNYPEIDPALREYGADVVRLYLLSSTSFGEPYRFSEKDLQHVKRNVYMTLWNVYSFFTRYARVWGWKRPIFKENTDPMSVVEKKTLQEIDRWVLARIHEFEVECISKADAYEFDKAARLLIPFVDDFSNWYIRRSRTRFQPSASSNDQAFLACAVLYSVLVRLSRLLAPFMPFITEEIFRNLTGADSVHLSELAAPQPLSRQERVTLKNMTEVRKIVSSVLAIRSQRGIKVRQPLSDVIVERDKLPHELTSLIQEEANVKSVVFGRIPMSDAYVRGIEEHGSALALNIQITDELKEEGYAREIIRQGQALRRKAGYGLSDRIVLIVHGIGGKTADLPKSGVIVEALQADRVVQDKTREDIGTDVTLGDRLVHIGVARA